MPYIVLIRSSRDMEMQFVLYSTRGSTGRVAREKPAESTLTLLVAWWRLGWSWRERWYSRWREHLTFVPVASLAQTTCAFSSLQQGESNFAYAVYTVQRKVRWNILIKINCCMECSVEYKQSRIRLCWLQGINIQKYWGTNCTFLDRIVG